MTKELEAKTEDISKLLYEVYDVPSGICEYIDEAFQRLEAIDNANPSEALECLESMYARLPQWDLCRNQDQHNTIKQALIQAEIDKKQLELYIQENTKLFSNLVNKSKKELAFDIIKGKNVMIHLLKCVSSVEEYNDYVSTDEQLTQEEFDTLKEALLDEKNK